MAAPTSTHSSDRDMKKIIFIVGSGRSGSTVLGKALGSHSEGFFAGEVQRLREIYARNTRCSCESRIRQCAFWREVLTGLASTASPGADEVPDLTVNFRVTGKCTGIGTAIRHLAHKIFSKRFTGKSGSEAVNDTIRLYDEIFRKTGARFIVDSGKNFFRALHIAAHAGHFDCRFIHLVRNGLDVLRSTRKNETTVYLGGRAVKIETIPSPTHRVIEGWGRLNRRILVLSRLLLKRRDRVLFRHEDLLSSPRQGLRTLSTALGITFEENMLKLDNKVHHIAGGNASRINARRIRPPQRGGKIRLDDALLKYFQRKAGRLNRRLGYTDEADI